MQQVNILDSISSSVTITMNNINAACDLSHLQLQASKNALQIRCNLCMFERYKGEPKSVVVIVKHSDPLVEIDNLKVTANFRKKSGKILITVPCHKQLK